MTVNNNKRQFQHFLIWATLIVLLCLIALSIIAACKGAHWAKTFFISPPLALFWMILTLLLTIGMIAFARLRQQTGLLLIHAGVVLTLIGAMWSSQPGHQLQKQILNIDKTPAGAMLIPEHQSDNTIYSDDLQQAIATLPFDIYLHDFAIDYYWDRAQLLISTAQGEHFKLPAQADQTIELNPPLPTIKIIKQFKNFKITVENEKKIAIDQPDTGSNPALELELHWPNGDLQSKYIFERFPEFGELNQGLFLRYSLMPSEYLSDLEVRRDGKALLRKTIEVNKPLHYGGYYFYQSSYDEKQGCYTILSVTSDTGRPLVFAGYALMAIGFFWHFWITQLAALIRKKSNGN